MVSLQPDNLHFIVQSTNSTYNHKILHVTEDGQSLAGDIWKHIPGMEDSTTEPVVCKWGGDIFVYGVNLLDGRLRCSRYNSTTGWATPVTLGDETNPRWVSKPAIAPLGVVGMTLFILGEDRAIWAIGFQGGPQEWTQPLSKIEGEMLFKEPPVLTVAEDITRLDIFGVTFDGSLYHMPSEMGVPGDQGNNNWRDITDGFLVTNQVQAIEREDRQFDLLVVGRDSKLYHRSGGFNRERNDYPYSWGDWKVVSVAGPCRGVPELVSYGSSRIDAFVIGTDGWVHHLKHTDDGWSVEDNKVLGPTNFDRPTAVSRERGKIDLAVVSSYGGIVYKSYSETDGWKPSGEGNNQISGSVKSRVGTAS